MGFPMANPDLFLPKTLLYPLTILSFFFQILSSILYFVDYFLNVETASSYPIIGEEDQSDFDPPPSALAARIRELLPVVKLGEVADRTPDRCVVCLNEFEGEDEEIRLLANCKHVFHRRCMDRWIDHDRKTCPLCRAQIVPEDMQEAFNDRVSGMADLYGDYSPITFGS